MTTPKQSDDKPTTAREDIAALKPEPSYDDFVAKSVRGATGPEPRRKADSELSAGAREIRKVYQARPMTRAEFFGERPRLAKGVEGDGTDVEVLLKPDELEGIRRLYARAKARLAAGEKITAADIAEWVAFMNETPEPSDPSVAGIRARASEKLAGASDEQQVAALTAAANEAGLELAGKVELLTKAFQNIRKLRAELRGRTR